MSKVLAADLAVIKSESKYSLLLPFVFAAIGVSNTFFRLFSVMMVVSLTINIMAYNERYGFDRYLLITPVSREIIVITRYVTAIGMAEFMLIIQFLLSQMRLANSEAMRFGDILVLGGTVCIYVAIMLPILIKLGVEKGRTAYMACMMIVAVGTVLLMEASPNLTNFESILELVVPVAGALAIIASCLISIRIYELREL